MISKRNCYAASIYSTNVASVFIAFGLTASVPSFSQTASQLEAQRPSPTGTLPTVQVTGDRSTDAKGVITQTQITNVGKQPVRVQDMPFAIGVVDAEQAKETGALNVQDALVYSAGVYAGRYGFDTRGDWVAIRGLGSSAYIDGLRFQYGSYNNVRPDLYTLDRIEVLKGPSSVLYGQAELGGIVNAVSKRPRKGAAREVEVQLGSHQRKQIAADLTGPLTSDGHWLYRLVALQRNSNTQVDHVHDNATVFMPSITWQPTPDTSAMLMFTHQKYDTVVSSQFLPSRGTIDPAPLGPIPSNRFVGEPGWDRYDSRKNELTALLQHRLSTNWSLGLNLRKTRSSSVTREIYTQVGAGPDALGNMPRTLHTADRKTDVLSSDFRLEGDLPLGTTRHRVAAGLDHQNAFWEEFNYTSANTGGTINVYQPVYGFVNLGALTVTDRPDNRIRQRGLYVMDHMEWGPWVLSAAMRRDDATNTVINPTTPSAVVKNSASTGRVGAMFRFANGISPYVSRSTAFVPNLGTDGTAAAGYLKPTSGKQTEAGVKFLSGSGNTSAAFAWFDIEQTNRIVDGRTPGGVDQVGARTKGWEIEARHRSGGLELMGNYTSLDAINTVTQKRLSSIADKTASVWAQYFLTNGWRVGAGVRHLGTRTGNLGVPVIPSVTLYDAMLAYSTSSSWEWRLSLRNLADKTYVSWCRGLNQDCGYGERRHALLSANYKF